MTKQSPRPGMLKCAAAWLHVVRNFLDFVGTAYGAINANAELSSTVKT